MLQGLFTMWGRGAGAHPPCRNSPAETLEINGFFLTVPLEKGSLHAEPWKQCQKGKDARSWTLQKTEEQAGPQVKELRGVTKVGKGCEE